MSTLARGTSRGSRRWAHWRLVGSFDAILLNVVGPASSLAWAASRCRAVYARVKSATLAFRLTSRAYPPVGGYALSHEILAKTPGASDAACGTAFLGRLRLEPVSDYEILAAYSERARRCDQALPGLPPGAGR